ncbi:MAG TPA: sugar ABC transporter permease [Anaerolineae bacterium]|nr:sugar ABC transporter permease [Anaerolineae bacterium]HPL27916.1 sugar ABC transporter permease [Anaerolineae bacterium]
MRAVLGHARALDGKTEGRQFDARNRLRRFLHLSEGYLFILPALLVLVVLILYPVVDAFWVSLHRTSYATLREFNPLFNYVSFLRDPTVLASLRISLVFTAAVIGGHFLLALLFATVLNTNPRGSGFFRTVALLPWVLSGVASGIIWRWIYDASFGPISEILRLLGVANYQIAWLGDMQLALPAVIVASIWKGFPFVMLMLLAGMQAIPTELYEAAKVDGATGLQNWRYITLPMLRNVIAICLILDTIWWFREFASIYTMTGGGPARATDVMVVHVYKDAFEFFEFGRAAAGSMVTLAISLCIMALYRRLLKADMEL